MTKRLIFYILYFFNVPILAEEEIDDNENFKNIFSTINYNNQHFKKLKNPLLNFPVETSTGMSLYEIKRFLSPLESNLAVDKNILNDFIFENKPSFFLSLTGLFLLFITLPYRGSVFNNQKFHFKSPNLFYLNS